MTKALPNRPDIEWLKKTAKQRLAELREVDSSCRLHQAQLEVARQYGFESWRALKTYVDALSLDGQIVAAAIEGRAADLAGLLKEHPAKLDIIGGQWRRPLLHLAAERGHIDCVEVLLGLGFDPNFLDHADRATALHWAAQAGRLAVVRRLVDAGTDIVGEGDAHGLGILGWATCFGQVHNDVAEFLVSRGASISIFSAVALNRPDLVQEIIEVDSSAISAQMSRFENHRTPLHFAVLKNQPEVVVLLLKFDADPIAKDSRGYTPLNYASQTTNKAIVEHLVAAGADPLEVSPNRFESAIPILNVANVPKAVQYYVDKLGFDKEWDWGTPPDFAGVNRDDVRIFLCQDGQGARGTWISVFVHDVDALYQEYQRSGAIVRQPPTSFPWGVREMNVEDLDGHRLRMGSDATSSADDVPLCEEP